jgi:hypothetical protein
MLGKIRTLTKQRVRHPIRKEPGVMKSASRRHEIVKVQTVADEKGRRAGWKPVLPRRDYGTAKAVP